MKFNVTSNGLIFFKKKDGITIEQNFPLKEISEDEIIEHRLSDVPGFILKKAINSIIAKFQIIQDFQIMKLQKFTFVVHFQRHVNIYLQHLNVMADVKK